MNKGAGYDVAAEPAVDPSKAGQGNRNSQSLPSDNASRRGSDAESVKSNGSKASSGTAGSQRASSRSKADRKKAADPNSSGAGCGRKKAQKTAEELEAENQQKEGLKIIAETFALANKGKKNREDDNGASSAAAAKAKVEAKKSGGKLGSGTASLAKAAKVGLGGEAHERESAAKKGSNGGLQIPDTFEGMMRFNAGMTGANMSYIEVVLRSFPSMVADVCSVGTLQEQTDFLALEIRKEVTGDYKTSEFRPCLMASMAALIPQRWNSTCEQAWSWFWESVEAQLQDSLQHAKVHERPVLRYVKGLTEKEYDELGTSLWKKLFKQEKQAELRHKQPTATFVRIAKLAIQFSAQIFENPFRKKEEIAEHALKHILHQVETRLFAVFVVFLEEEIRTHSKDESVTAGVNWAVSVIASLMARTVQQTSSPILVCAVKNDEKGLMKAIEAVPRGVRAQKQLHA